jgi:hypothetical protein
VRVGVLGPPTRRNLHRGLTDVEHETLRELLGKLADGRHLTPGVHPGYR